MATLYLTEFADIGDTIRGSCPIVRQPPEATQTVPISGVSASSNPFADTTRIVRLNTDSICSIKIATGSFSAATSDMRLAANQTEYFSIPGGQSYKIAVILNT